MKIRERLSGKRRKINRHLWRWGSFAWDMRKTIQKRRNSLVGEEKYFRKKNEKNFCNLQMWRSSLTTKYKPSFCWKELQVTRGKISTSWVSFLLFLFFVHNFTYIIFLLSSPFFFTIESNILIIISELTVLDWRKTWNDFRIKTSELTNTSLLSIWFEYL